MYPQLIQQFIDSHRLPSHYGDDVEQWVAPFLDKLVARLSSPGSRPLLLGLNGAQGTGKSTLGQLITLILEGQGFTVVCLSIDDFYLGKAERNQLAQAVHPLLQTRGVPGTHDIDLLNNTLESLLQPQEIGSVNLPRFDKATDDRVSESQFLQQSLPVDLIILEGWCVGAVAESEQTLSDPINQLEAEEDADGAWRRYVNDKLRSHYEPLFARMDGLVFLQAPSFDQVFEWRSLQERKLKAIQTEASPGVMNESQLHRFIQHYERITQQCLTRLPSQADVIFRLDKSHRIVGREDASGHF